jgi:hypothetical protein
MLLFHDVRIGDYLSQDCSGVGQGRNLQPLAADLAISLFPDVAVLNRVLPPAFGANEVDGYVGPSGGRWMIPHKSNAVMALKESTTAGAQNA